MTVNSTDKNLKKIIQSAFNQQYSADQSEIASILRKFWKKLNKLPKQAEAFLEDMKNKESNLSRILKIIDIADPDFFVLHESPGYKKCSTVADEFRKLGNEAYRNRNFSKAIQAYSLCLLFSPTTGLSLPFGNRSAVFFECGQYASCLLDIGRAFDHSIPEELKSKLLQRQSKCLSKLEISNVFTQEQSEEFFKKMRDKFEKYSSTESTNQQNYLESQIFKLKAANPMVPSAEEFVRIQNNTERGRHLVSEEAIGSGTVLIVERPYARVLLSEFRWDVKHCHNCHQVTYGGIPCSGCVFAYYCNTSCQDEALKNHHKYECQIASYLYQLKAPRTLLLSLRILTTLGPTGLRHFWKAQNSKDDLHLSPDGNEKKSVILGNTNGIYTSDNYEPIYNLISHPQKSKASELLSYAITSLVIAKLLEQHTSFFEGFQNEANEGNMFQIVASLILLHLQNLPCNAHSLNELNFLDNPNQSDSIRTAHNSEYGAGAFALLSLVNHSCFPNSFRVNHSDGRTALISLRPLAAGEEILDNYGHHYAVEEYAIRQNELLENYYFNCLCEACRSPRDWKLFNQMKLNPVFRFTCDPCRTQNQRIQVLEPKSDSEVDILVCAICQRTYVKDALIEIYERNVDGFLIGHELVMQNDPMKAIPYLIECLDYFNSNLKLPSIKVNETEETLKQAYNLLCSNYKTKSVL